MTRLSGSTLLLVLLLAASTLARCPEKCQCEQDETFISCVDQILSYMPALPQKVRILNLSNIYLGPIVSDSFGTMKNLTQLILSRNNIVSISGQSFKHLSKLTHLDLSDNDLRNLEDSLFGDTHMLRVLDLRGNGLTSFDETFYRHLPNLHELYLSNNNFYHLKFGLRFQVLTKLQILDLSYNDFGDVTNDAFEHLLRWNNNVKRKLDLSYCKITSVENGTFIPFYGLHDLHLTGITTLSSENLTSIMNDLQHTETKRLDLSYMDLEDISNLFTESAKISLEFLNLSHNKIENVSRTALVNLGTLYHMDFSFNRMKLLQPGFAKLAALKFLDISHNQLTGLRGQPARRMTSLETLVATHNEFDRRSQLKLSKLKNLKRLDLSHNTLDELVMTGESLQELILSGNNITSLDIIPDAENLRLLDISHNKMTTLSPYMFSSAINIETVDFSHNQISLVDQLAFLPNSTNAYVINLSGNKLKRVTFGGWLSAKALDLSHNEITEVDFHAFQGMNNLETLDLSHNLITHFHDQTFKYLINLERLNLAYNKLENHRLHERIKNTFTTLVSLADLDLQSNNISYLDSFVFEDNKNLVHISLADNTFSNISPQLLSELKKLKQFDLSRNPYMCNCELLPLVNWLTTIDSSIFQSARTTYICVGPFDRRGKKIFDYKVTFLECNDDLLNVIVFGSLGGLTIFVGIVGTLVCRFYHRWSIGVLAKKKEEKKKKDTKSQMPKKYRQGTAAVEDMPFEVLDELDHQLKRKLMTVRQNGPSQLPNGTLMNAYPKEKYRRLERAEGERKSRKDIFHLSSKSKDKKGKRSSSRSRSKSKEKDRSSKKNRDSSEKRQRERLRHYEKELRYALARYNPTNRWDAQGRDRWALLAQREQRQRSPEMADRFYTLPTHRRPPDTLQEYNAMRGRSQYSRHGTFPGSPERRIPQSREKLVSDQHLQRLSPVFRYDVVRASKQEPDDGYHSHDNRTYTRMEMERGFKAVYPDKYQNDPQVHFIKNQRLYVRPEYFERAGKPTGDRIRYETMPYSHHHPVRTEREYVELPFRDPQPYPPRVRLPASPPPQRSRSYGDIDIETRRRRYADEPERMTGTTPNLNKDWDQEVRVEHIHEDKSNQADHYITDTSQSRDVNQVQAEIHNEISRKTPDPDYPNESNKCTEWI